MTEKQTIFCVFTFSVSAFAPSRLVLLAYLRRFHHANTLVYTAVKHLYNFDIHVEYVGAHFQVTPAYIRCIGTVLLQYV